MDTLRIGLITTLNRNIGDDFIRDGIVQILSHVFAKREIRFVPVDKHVPFTVYPRWHPLRWLQAQDRLPRGRRVVDRVTTDVSSAAYRFGGSRFDPCGVIVQCGAPVMWSGCHRCEWAVPLWDQVVGRLSERVAVLNLAAGSAYPWEDQPQTIIEPSDADFLRRIMNYCKVTTARDALTSQLALTLGVSVPTLPCSAFLVGRRLRAFRPTDDGLVLFNYMPGAGHFEWRQGINHEAWLKTARLLIERLSKRHRVAFICHDRKEYEAAELVNPELPRFLPTTIREYLSIIANSKAAVCNRLHAAVALASTGLPSISVGTDTRLLMVAAIGLPYRYVKNIDVEQLEEDFEGILRNRKDERDRLIELRERTWRRYADEVTKAVAA
jgi:hypothetical protein